MNIGVNMPAVPKVEIPDENYKGRIYRGEWTELLDNKTLSGSLEEIRNTINQTPKEIDRKSSFMGIPDSTFTLLGEVLFYLLLVVLLSHYAYWGVTIYLSHRRSRLTQESEDITKVNDNESDETDKECEPNFLEYQIQESYQPGGESISVVSAPVSWIEKESGSFEDPIEYDIERGKMTRLYK